MRCFLRKLATNAMHGSAVKRSIFLWSGRSADATMTFQAAIEISCHDHSTTVWVGRCYILLRYLVFVFVVRFLFIRWFPCIRHSIIFWWFPHVMVRVPLQYFQSEVIVKCKHFLPTFFYLCPDKKIRPCVWNTPGCKFHFKPIMFSKTPFLFRVFFSWARVCPLHVTTGFNQWRSEAKCRPGPTIKVPPFQPLKFAYKNF